MKVAFYTNDGQPVLKEANVRREDFGKVLSLFRNRRVDRKPMKWESMGEIDIATESADLKIQLFRTGDGPGAFRIGKNYFRASTDEQMEAMLQVVHGAATRRPDPKLNKKRH